MSTKPNERFAHIAYIRATAGKEKIEREREKERKREREKERKRDFNFIILNLKVEPLKLLQPEESQLPILL